MTDFFIRTYRYLSRKRALFYILLTLTSLVFITIGSKVEYEEDISKLLPATEESQSAGFAFNNLKVKDKIFLEFLPKNDTSYSVDEYYLLYEAADAFADSLLTQDTATNYIADLTYRLDEYLLQDALAWLFENVPQFIDDKFYPAFDSLLNPEYADSIMAENVDLLSSAEGMMWYDIVRNDPLAIRKIFMEQNKDAAKMMGGSYKIVDNHFFTPDSTVAIAFLSPNFKAFDSQSGTYLVEMLESEIEKFEANNPDIEILFHGAPIQSVFNSRQIKKDLASTLTFSLALVCLIIWFCFKNKSTLIMLLAPVVYGAFFALAAIYLIKGSMSLMALGIGAIVLGVALSYCLHVLTHYKYVSDPEQVIREQAKPVILGTLTTIGAFAGLLFTKSELLSDFGLFASLAMVGTTLFCLIFLPHFFRPQSNRINAGAFRFIEKINTFPYERQYWMIAIVVILFLIGAFWTGRDVEFDSNLKNIGYNEPDVMRSQQIMAEKTMPGMESKYYAVLSKDPDSAFIYNARLNERCKELADSGLIKKFTNSAMLLLPKGEVERRISLWENYWSESKKAEVGRLLAKSGKSYGFKEGMFQPFMDITEADYQYNPILEAGIIPEGLMANLVEYTDSTYLVFTSAQALPEDMLEVSNSLVKKSEGIPSNSIIVADPFFYTQNMVELLNNDFNIVLGISSLFVLIVLLLSFRNIPVAVIAFLPMAMSWYIVLGIMGAFGLQFNLINIVISTFIFGIGVDYSIFVMDGLLGRGNPKLLTYHKTAIFFSAIVLIIGIASLMFATHPAISSIGVATLIGMGSTIIITYTLEPFLFNFYKKWKDGKK